MLAQEIEKEKAEREKAAAEAAIAATQASVSPAPPTTAGEGDGAKVVKGEPGENAANGNAGQGQKDGEGDVKMEER